MGHGRQLYPELWVTDLGRAGEDLITTSTIDWGILSSKSVTKRYHFKYSYSQTAVLGKHNDF